MLNSFIIVLRKGFESFLLVAVIIAYMRKAGQKWLTSAVYVGIALAISASMVLAYVLKNGINDEALESALGPTLGAYVSQFFGNEALREAVLGVVAIVMVGTLVVHMWRTGPQIQTRMRERLSAMSRKSSRVAALAGVFLFTFLMITRKGMETALLLCKCAIPQLVSGAVLGLAAAAAFAGAGRDLVTLLT
jgi:high-affinity iron transporter